MEKRIRINEIAKLAGVNVSTVSRALNPATAQMISNEQREKILKIADEKNYRPRLMARSFVTGKTYKIGMIMGALEKDFTSPLLGLFFKGLSVRLQKENYLLTMLNAGGNALGVIDETRRLLMSDIADGYILGTSMLSEAANKTLTQNHRPVLGINIRQKSLADYSSIIFDDNEAYKEIWRLIPAHCYNKILFAGQFCENSHMKFEMIKNTAPEKEIIKSCFFKSDNLGFVNDRMNGFNFAAENLTAIAGSKIIWCASDLNALGILDYLKLKNIDNIAIIGHDNIESFPNFCKTPKLSTVDPMMYEAGIQAADFLLARITNNDCTPANIIIKSKFINRNFQINP